MRLQWIRDFSKRCSTVYSHTFNKYTYARKKSIRLFVITNFSRVVILKYIPHLKNYLNQLMNALNLISFIKWIILPPILIKYNIFEEIFWFKFFRGFSNRKNIYVLSLYSQLLKYCSGTMLIFLCFLIEGIHLWCVYNNNQTLL